MRQEGTDRSQLDRAQGALYGFEHWLAWLMAAVAIALGAIGLLVGFGVFDLRDITEGAGAEIPAGQVALSQSFLDGMMVIFAGISAAILAYTLHASDHHRMRNMSSVASSERALYSTEHSLAYLMALGAIVLVVIGLLTGFNTFSSDHSQLDGLIWIFTGFGAGILTATLHTVRHHQTVEEDELVEMVATRVRAGAPGTTGGQAQQPR